MRISFITKVTRVHKAMTVANESSLCFIILVVFLEFIPVDRAKISHMNTPQNSSRLPGSYEETLCASRNAVNLAKKAGKTAPNTNNVNDFFFYLKTKTNNKKANRQTKSTTTN